MKKAKISALLAENSLFSALPAETREGLLSDPRVSFSEYSAGETVYTTEGFQKALAVILSGGVSVFRPGRGSPVLLNRLSAGQVFGAASLFGGGETYVTVIVAEKKAAILFVPGEVCEELLSSSSAFSLSYIRFLSDRIRFLNRRLSQLSAPGAPKKLADFFCRGPDRVSPNMKLLASSLGIGRASLYRILDDFLAKGYLARDGKELLVTDREGLSKLL